MIYFACKLNMICRCRLAVWRQLPKLISAGPTPVTCSKKKLLSFDGGFLLRKIYVEAVKFFKKGQKLVRRTFYEPY